MIALAFAYGEGVRALARRWVPMVDRRARALGPGSARRHRAFAPLYAMGLVGASRGLTARAWIGLALVVTAVFIVRAMPEPWRGIIDLSVAIALSIGILALARLALRRGM